MRASRIGSKDKNLLQKPPTVPKSYLHGCKQYLPFPPTAPPSAPPTKSHPPNLHIFQQAAHTYAALPIGAPPSVSDLLPTPYPSTQYQRTPNTPQHHHPPLPSFPNHHPYPPNSQLTLKPHPPPFSLSPSPPVPQFPNSPTPTSTPTSTPT